jgi:hypothetical protein
MEEEYSRLSDPAKWRIVGARADAWCTALVEMGLATVEQDAAVRWEVPPTTIVARTDRVVPRQEGAIPLLVGRHRLDDVDDVGVTLGVGDPAARMVWIPDCGCDACDSGSQDVLDELDEHMRSVVTGAFRLLRSGSREIRALGSGRWAASGEFGRLEVDAVLVDPVGWDEVSGRAWLDAR